MHQRQPLPRSILARDIVKQSIMKTKNNKTSGKRFVSLMMNQPEDKSGPVTIKTNFSLNSIAKTKTSHQMRSIIAHVSLQPQPIVKTPEGVKRIPTRSDFILAKNLVMGEIRKSTKQPTFVIMILPQPFLTSVAVVNR